MKRLTLALAASATLAAPAEAAVYLSDYEIPVVRAANSFGAPALDAPMGLFTNQAFVVVAPLTLAVATHPEDMTGPILVLASEGLAYGATSLLKPVFNRPRPYQSYPDLRTPNGTYDHDPMSFPSGHAAVSFAAATALADYHPGLALPAYALAALITYSRLYNGHHYPTDVLAGALVGVGVGKFTRWGLDRINGRYGFPMLGMQPTGSFQDGYTLGFARRF